MNAPGIAATALVAFVVVIIGIATAWSCDSNLNGTNINNSSNYYNNVQTTGTTLSLSGNLVYAALLVGCALCIVGAVAYFGGRGM